MVDKHTHSDQVQKVVGLKTNKPSAIFLLQQNCAEHVHFARYPKKSLFYQTEDNSSNTQQLKNWNYLATSCNYWGKRDFLQEKVGSFIFLIANLFFKKFFKNLYYFTHEKIIFSMI